jgi:hypothetical protein
MHAVPVVERGEVERRRAAEAGVGDAHRERAHASRDRTGLGHRSLVGDVAPDRVHLRVGQLGQDRRDPGGEPLLRTAREHHRRTVAGEVPCAAEPDAAAATGDQGAVSGELGRGHVGPPKGVRASEIRDRVT